MSTNPRSRPVTPDSYQLRWKNLQRSTVIVLQVVHASIDLLPLRTLLDFLDIDVSALCFEEGEIRQNRVQILPHVRFGSVVRKLAHRSRIISGIAPALIIRRSSLVFEVESNVAMRRNTFGFIVEIGGPCCLLDLSVKEFQQLPTVHQIRAQ